MSRSPNKFTFMGRKVKESRTETFDKHQIFVLPLTTHTHTSTHICAHVCTHKMIRINFWNYLVIHIQQWFMLTQRLQLQIIMIISNFNNNANILSFLSRLSFPIKLYNSLTTTPNDGILNKITNRFDALTETRIEKALALISHWLLFALTVSYLKNVFCVPRIDD